MSKRILSVSYDGSLLATRQMLLETRGYLVASAHGFSEAVSNCRQEGFDLFILGHSIPVNDKRALMHELRKHCAARILSLERWAEPRVESDFHASPDNPGELLNLIERILSFLTPAQERTNKAEQTRQN